MSAIQNIKNFIRHGKQARIANFDDPTRKQDQSPPNAQQTHQREMAPVSEPVVGAVPNAGQPMPDAYSVAPGQGQNRAAQAGHVAAHHAEADQTVSQAKSKTKRVDDSSLAQLVAEENASRGKFPRYPGLERWELLEKMGDGAFSNVYRARDLEGNAGEVAIKVVRKYEMNNLQGNRHLHPDFKKVPKAAERSNILKEVQIMRQLEHPNIIRLVDFSESRQYYFIILELAPGGELFHQIVRLTYFSEDLSRHVILQVAKALEYLHEEKGVVHRDIKPENILFYPTPFVPARHPRPKQAGDEDKADEGEFIPGVGAGGIGQVKIADFGLSKVIYDNQTMTPCGTVGYTAPEIVKDERYSKSVDMWALGCVLYTLLCGFPPFYDESIDVLTEKVAKGQYTFLTPWWDDISASAQDLISHLLTVDPDRRYTIQEFLNHPWIRVVGPTPREEKKFPDGPLRAFDAAKIVEGDRRYDFRSPGAVNLREIFDVGYAVHRQEEEGKRRRQVGAKGVGGGPAVPGAVPEESEDDDEMRDSSGGDDDINNGEYVARIGPQTATQQLEHSMRNAQIRDYQEKERDRERGRDREHHHRATGAQEQQRGYGQHSATVTAAARQQVRERNRQKGAFELNMDGATLLGRRKHPMAA